MMRISAGNFAAEVPLLFTIGIIIIFSIVGNTNNATLYGQTFQSPPPLPSSNTTSATPSSPVAHGVRITSPVKGQQVPIGDLTISGTSRGNGTADCQVSIIVNGVKPYQNASATGAGGASDYSKWNFFLTSNYTSIKEGLNKITSKFSCRSNPALASFYSVNVTGTRGGSSLAIPPPSTNTTGPQNP